jgi:hypothetical protein
MSEEIISDLASLIKAGQDPTSKYYIEPEHFDRVSFPHLKNGFIRRDGVNLPSMFKNLTIIKNIAVRPDDVFIGIRT